MIEDPFFSIVIPLYNKEEYIVTTIDSVLSQNYSNFEVIIVDDGSTDNSAQLIKNYSDERVNYYYQNNAGVSSARNKGIELANFDLIAFLDGDDLWEKEYLKSIVELYHLYPNVSVYATAYNFKSEDGKLSNARFSITKNYLPNKLYNMIEKDS